MKGDGIVQGGIIIFDKNGKARYAYREGKYSAVHVLVFFCLCLHILVIFKCNTTCNDLLHIIRIIADISYSNSIETGFEVPISDILAAVKEVKAETI